jgi:hypothetical protein
MRSEIGQTLYLFHNQGEYANDVVISAHGGYPQNKPTYFQVPGNTVLKFYSVHGDTATDFGLTDFTNAVGKIKETKNAGDQCVNYHVSKYQKRGAGKGLWASEKFQKAGRSNETYASIEQARDHVHELNDLYAGALATMSPDQIRAQFGLSGQIPPFDVVTIRSRWAKTGDAAYSGGSLDLNTVLDRVAQVHAYGVVHCFFCRSPY